MKKILFISSILTTFIFTGCGTVNPNLPTQSVDVKKSDVNIPYDGETVFENVENSETLIKGLSNYLKSPSECEKVWMKDKRLPF